MVNLMLGIKNVKPKVSGKHPGDYLEDSGYVGMELMD